jgi:hypothetical protein
MQQFKLGFRNRTALEQLNICERVVAGIATLPEELRTEARNLETIATVSALRDSHNRVEMLRSELKGEVSRRKDLLREARNRVTGAALGIRGYVNAEPAKLLAAGLDLAAPKTVLLGKCPAPENLRAETHALEGVVKLRWKYSMRRCVFAIEFRAESCDEKDWQQYEIRGKRSLLVKGLTSGVKYWFRVRAHGTLGEGPWSNPVCARVR